MLVKGFFACPHGGTHKLYLPGQNMKPMEKRCTLSKYIIFE